MPSRISLFFRRDRTRSGQSNSDNTQRNRVRKRLSLFSSEAAKPSRGPTLASDNASPDKVPRPQRSIRASTANVPELPSYPIYQTFNPSRHLSLLPYDRPRGNAPSSDRRPARIASVADFQALRRRRSRQTLNRNAAVLKADNPPAYDRAAELGTFYRSILPDFQSMCEEEEARDTEDSKPADDQEQALQAGEGTCPRITEEEGEKEAAGTQETPSVAHISPAPDPTRNTPSVASSTTAVERDDHGAITGAQQPEPEQHNPQESQTASNTWPLPAPTPSAEPTAPSSPSPSPPPPIPKRHPSRNRRSHTTTTTTTTTQHQHSPAALQICTELLTAQLRTALSLNQVHQGHHQGHHHHHQQQQQQGERRERQSSFSSSIHDTDTDTNTDQTQTQHQQQQQQQRSGDDNEREQKQTQTLQQVLLLIEAYEGVLRRCRREMMALALGFGSGSVEGGDGECGSECDVAREERKGRVGEAVAILEHWLGTLRAVVCEGGVLVGGEGRED